MNRFLSLLLLAISTLLCIAIFALWLRSYLSAAVVMYSRTTTDPLQMNGYSLIFIRGEMIYYHRQVSFDDESQLRRAAEEAPPGFQVVGRANIDLDAISAENSDATDAFRPRFGLRLLHSPTVGTFFFIPIWPLAILTALPPMLRSFHKKRPPAEPRRWESRRHCHMCGFDLKGAVDKCPDCGEPIPNVRKA